MGDLGVHLLHRTRNLFRRCRLLTCAVAHHLRCARHLLAAFVYCGGTFFDVVDHGAEVVDHDVDFFGHLTEFVLRFHLHLVCEVALADACEAFHCVLDRLGGAARHDTDEYYADYNYHGNRNYHYEVAVVNYLVGLGDDAECVVGVDCGEAAGDVRNLVAIDVEPFHGIFELREHRIIHRRHAQVFFCEGINPFDGGTLAHLGRDFDYLAHDGDCLLGVKFEFFCVVFIDDVLVANFKIFRANYHPTRISGVIVTIHPVDYRLPYNAHFIHDALLTFFEYGMFAGNFTPDSFAFGGAVL